MFLCTSPPGIVTTDEIILFQDQAVFELNWEQILTLLYSQWAPVCSPLCNAEFSGQCRQSHTVNSYCGLVHLVATVPGYSYSPQTHTPHTHTHMCHTHTPIPPTLSPCPARSKCVPHVALLPNGPNPVTRPALLHLPETTSVVHRGLHEGHEPRRAGGLPRPQGGR